MKLRWIVAMIAAAAGMHAAQAQDTGNWLVRARAVSLDSANTNDDKLKATLLAVTSAPVQASINDKWLPEVDITYFFSPNLAAELILTYPQKQTLSVGGGAIGTFKHLPPTLTFQYHVTGLQGFRPYVGAGLNFTNISAVKFDASVAPLQLNLKRNSYGLAFQVGADIPMGGGWVFNLDAKKVQIKTTVYSAGTDVGTFKVDPTLLSVGFGKRF